LDPPEAALAKDATAGRVRMIGVTNTAFLRISLRVSIESSLSYRFKGSRVVNASRVSCKDAARS